MILIVLIVSGLSRSQESLLELAANKSRGKMRNRRKQSSNGIIEREERGGGIIQSAGSSHIRDSLVTLVCVLLEPLQKIFPFIETHG